MKICESFLNRLVLPSLGNGVWCRLLSVIPPVKNEWLDFLLVIGIFIRLVLATANWIYINYHWSRWKWNNIPSLVHPKLITVSWIHYVFMIQTLLYQFEVMYHVELDYLCIAKQCDHSFKNRQSTFYVMSWNLSMSGLFRDSNTTKPFDNFYTVDVVEFWYHNWYCFCTLAGICVLA